MVRTPGCAGAGPEAAFLPGARPLPLRRERWGEAMRSPSESKPGCSFRGWLAVDQPLFSSSRQTYLTFHRNSVRLLALASRLPGLNSILLDSILTVPST